MGSEIIILFALAAMFCWGIGDFLIQKSTRKIGNVESLAFIGIIGTIGLIPFIIKEIPLLFSLPNFLLLLLLGAITFFIALFNFEALKKGKLSVIDVIIELELPVTIILGFLFFRETLSYLQIFVISLIFIGIVLMATKSFKHFKTKLEKGVLFALIAAIGMGLINFLTAASSKQVSPLMAIWVPWLIFSIICILYIGKREGLRKLVKNSLKFRYLILFMGIFDTAAWLFYAFAVHESEISIITAITESYPAIALFLGVFINREKIKWYQYLGAILALLLSFILALTLL
ncbi:MAG: DMT family transporter [Nanoarchaeota archaeon]|nr:DMT family transporter [Nanoarchaeota archaeon]